MSRLAEFVLKAQIISKGTGQAGANHNSSEHYQSTQFNNAESSVAKSSYNNWGTGSQYNNEEGSQNVATTGGMQFVSSIFYGEVHFGLKKEEARAEILQRLRVWLLGNHTANERYDTSIHRRLKNTCNWILDREKFKNWRSEPSSSPKLFWIHGPAGFGKTVLCARIIEHIKIKQQEDVAYYFFSSDLEGRKDPMTAMRSWIYHLTLINESVIDIVNKAWGHGVAASETVIIELFREAIKMVSSCTLVIDGLDECVPGSSCLSVAEFIKELNEAVHGSNTRILVMSRTESSIRNALMEVKSAEFSEYEVCERDVHTDIGVLSKHIVAEKLSNGSAIIQDEMARKMGDRSKGQFLWLRLQQDSLHEGLNEKELRHAVETTPADLSSVYARTWRSISRLPKNDRARAISLLRLAAFSLRPLTVREISEAVLVSDENSDFPAHELPSHWDKNYVKERILDLCYSLLETRMQGLESPIEDWTIHLTHFSVKEFLLDHIPYQKSVQRNSRSMTATEHNILANLCITFMNYSYAWKDSAGDEAPRLGSFTSYAAKFWNKHAEAGAASQAKLMKVNRFFDENSPSWVMWRKWFDSTHVDWNNAKSDPAIPLCYAIELEFVDLAMAMIKKGKIRVNYNSSNRTALGVACAKGYEALARELLAYGAKVGIRDAQGRTAVYYAAMNGHSGLVKLLIDNGADITIRDHNGVSPFLAASANGHLNTMRRLIQKGADVNQLDRNGDGALFKASSNGHIKAARLLIGKGVHHQQSNHIATPPVIAALLSGSSNLTRLLIDQEGVDINATSRKTKETILHVASAKGKTDIVKLLVHRVANLSVQDTWGQAPLFHACINGYFDIAELLLTHGAYCNIATKNSQTPLSAACCNGHFEIVKLLIQNNVDMTTRNGDGKTVLYMACVNRHLKIARLLIDHGADITICDKWGNMPLSGAAFAGSFEIVQMLLEMGANVSTAHSNRCTAILRVSETGYTDIAERLIKWNDEDIIEPGIINESLLIASHSGHAGTVAMLLNNGANPRYSRPGGETPLYAACCNGHKEVANLLIGRGADIMATAEKEQTPLFAASVNGHLDLVILLMQKGANPNARNIDGMNAAYAAACAGQIEVLRQLLLLGADIFNKSKANWLPIHIASEGGHAETVDLLIENGSEVMVGNSDRNTPLVLATINRRVDVVNVLLKHGVDVDARDSFGQTSLLLASSRGDAKLAKLLVDNCANVSIVDDKGRTPLFYASWNGHLEIVKLLLDNGADMMPDKEGRTPAFMASFSGRINVLRLLIKSGADVTLSDDWGHTPIHASCFFGHIKPTKLLLKRGLDINSTDREGFWPLYSASEKGHVTIAKHLISNGADIFKKNRNGWSCINIASENGHTKIVKLLSEHGVDAEHPDGNGNTPLFAACQAGHIRTARYLVKRGVNVERAANRTTPLISACLHGHMEVVKLLLRHGADISAVNQDGMTPHKAALQNGHNQICELLYAHYRQINENRGLPAPPNTIEERQFEGPSTEIQSGEFVGGYNGVCQNICNDCQCRARQPWGRA